MSITRLHLSAAATTPRQIGVSLAAAAGERQCVTPRKRRSVDLIVPMNFAVRDTDSYRRSRLGFRLSNVLGSNIGSKWRAVFGILRAVSCAGSTKGLTATNQEVARSSRAGRTNHNSINHFCSSVCAIERLVLRWEVAGSSL